METGYVVTHGDLMVFSEAHRSHIPIFACAVSELQQLIAGESVVFGGLQVQSTETNPSGNTDDGISQEVEAISECSTGLEESISMLIGENAKTLPHIGREKVRARRATRNRFILEK